MSQHRFLDLVQSRPVQAAELATPVSGAFVACPIVLQGPARVWQEQIYQLAFEQARAVVRPSILERWQRPSVN
jgi:hypothetical protein